MDSTVVRELATEPERIEAFSVLSELRSHLTTEEYSCYLNDMLEEGYRLFALFDNDEMVAVAGATIHTNFYNGKHIFVYDLITKQDRRSEGHGSTLMENLEGWAKNQGCECMILESGLRRDDAHRFYEEKFGMDRYCYSFKKEI